METKQTSQRNASFTCQRTDLCNAVKVICDTTFSISITMPLAVGLSGASLRFGAPLHSAPSPSNPSRAAAVNMAHPL